MVATFPIQLQYDTPPEWAQYVVQHFDEFLQDHANCERKASALAMSLVVKYADRTSILPPLIELAQEELAHFRQVYDLMQARGLQLGKEIKDPYVNSLLALYRSSPEQRYVDRMLVASIIECRGAERFRLIAEAQTDETLKRFYARLWGSEAKHGQLFAQLLLHDYSPVELQPRLQALLAAEADIVKHLEWRPSLH